ncbi:MAG: winged helix-turn-helix transcriptional regulator [Clostridia bacterium]|nr:winged helix-turn-helix transcriptional regulator [Clostridia bacterium]
MQERFQTFTMQIAKISRCIRRIKTEEMAEVNLKSPHVSCLHYLYKYGPMTATELCELCEEDKAAVSRSIEYLEENGYVACERTAKKRYKTPLCLTEKGTAAGALIEEKIDGIVSLASEGLDEESRTVFYRALALIGDNLQKICERNAKKKE